MWKLAQLALLAAVPVFAQPLAFEVASIRATQHGRDAQGWSYSSVNVPSPGRLVAQNSSLDELIRFAYDLKDYQVSGPPWLNDDSECFDIEAKASPDTSQQQVRIMLQNLLGERFQLSAHHESRVLPVYDLVVAKNGFKLKPVAPGGRNRMASGGGIMTATNVTMVEFAYDLSRHLKYPVFDKTEVTGAFDFTLHYGSEQDASNAPSIFTAIQETVGVRLERTKGPVDVLVIDRINKLPTEN